MDKCYFIKRKANCKPVKCQCDISKVSGTYNLFCTSHVFLEKRHTKNELLQMYQTNESCNGHIYKYKAHKSLSSFFTKRSKKKKKRDCGHKSPYFEPPISSELDDAIQIMGLKMGCNKDDVKLAYRVKSLLLHPDKNISDTTVQMQQLNAAREILLQNV